MGWVANATPRPLYPRERPGTHCIGGWLDPWAGPDGCGKSRLLPGFEIRSPDRPALSEPLYRLRYPGPPKCDIYIYIYIYIYVFMYIAQEKNKSLILFGRHEEMKTLDVDWKIILKWIL
jgi:hypothetical protein